MSTGPRYETAHELGQRIGHTDSVVCTDCGVFVLDKAAHTGFHATLEAEEGLDKWLPPTGNPQP